MPCTIKPDLTQAQYKTDQLDWWVESLLVTLNHILKHFNAKSNICFRPFYAACDICWVQ